MIQEDHSNNWFNSKRETKLGDVGELIIKALEEKQGNIVYKCLTDASHPIDFIIMGNKQEGFKLKRLVEVKTKSMNKRYDSTGFNTSSYEAYKEIEKALGIPVLVYFVDASLGKIYGNYLSELSKPYTIIQGSYTNIYPSEIKFKNSYGKEEKVTMFHKSQMKEVCKLTEDQIKALKEYDNKND